MRWAGCRSVALDLIRHVEPALIPFAFGSC